MEKLRFCAQVVHGQALATFFRKNENKAIKNRGNRGFGGWIANMSEMVRYGGRLKRGRRDWAGAVPPCRSPVADRICTSRAHGEKFSILAQVVKGRNEEKKRSEETKLSMGI